MELKEINKLLRPMCLKVKFDKQCNFKYNEDWRLGHYGCRIDGNQQACLIKDDLFRE